MKFKSIFLLPALFDSLALSLGAEFTRFNFPLARDVSQLVRKAVTGLRILQSAGFGPEGQK